LIAEKPGGKLPISEAGLPEFGRSAGILCFGAFEVDLQTGEVHKHGLKIRLPEQSFQILTMLLEHPGDVVTRDQLRERLWSADTFVDFDHSVSATINKLRAALGDSAENPRFVETLARRGCWFIAPVNRRGEADRQAADSRALPANIGDSADVEPHNKPAPRRRVLGWSSGLLVLMGVTGIGVWFGRSKTGMPEALRVAVPLTTYPGTENTPSFSPDGTQVAFVWCSGGPRRDCHIYIKQVAVGTSHLIMSRIKKRS